MVLGEWMKTFLCGKTQEARVHNTLSSKGLILQGSILGPLLFSIYAQIPSAFLTLIYLSSYAISVIRHASRNVHCLFVCSTDKHKQWDTQLLLLWKYFVECFANGLI